VIVDQRGKKTTYDFDTQFRTTSITDHDGNATNFEYDSADNITCVEDALGNKTGFTFDTAGNVTHIIDALNTDSGCDLDTGADEWTFTYTGLNDIDLETDPRGNKTDYVYDGSGNLTQVLRKDSGDTVKQMTCFTRNGDGLVTELIESTNLSTCSGNKTLFGYDTYGNVNSVVDPRFSSAGSPPGTTMTYDLGGRRLTVTNELDHTTTFTYDNQNNVLTAEDNLDNETTYTYDAKGNLLTITDANSNVTTYAYDDADRLISVTDAELGVTSYGYDAVGNRTSVTNANRTAVSTPESGADCGGSGTGDGVDNDSDTAVDDGCPSTTYAYDNVGRLSSETDALGNVWSYTYDDAGRLDTRTDPESQVTSYAFNARGELTGVDYPVGTTDVSYDYDEVGNRVEMVDATGTTTYVYDAVDRPTYVYMPGSRTVAYGYNNVGNRSSTTYPSTDIATYGYDEANNLDLVTDWNVDQTTYTYDDAGLLETATLANGIVGTYSYDAADRLLGIAWTKSGTPVASAFYELDAVGNRLSRTTRPVQEYSDAIKNDGPLGYWRLGEASGTTAADESGNSNDGMYVDTPALGSIGAINAEADTAVTFDGTSEHVSLGDKFDFAGTQPFSVEAWVYPTTIDGGYRKIVHKNYYDGQNQGWDLHVHDNGGGDYGVVFERIEDDTWNAVGGEIEINQWSHIVGTFDGTEMRIYVNGELVDYSTFSPPVNLPDSSQDFQIAGDGGDFAGSIDDVAVYDYSLSEAAVDERFVQMASTAQSDIVLADNPDAYIRLGESSGTTATDASPNGNDGTYEDTPTLSAAGAIQGDPDTAVAFDGTSEHVSLGDKFDFAGTQSFSVEAWVYPTTIDGGYRKLVHKNYYDGQNQGWDLHVHDNGGGDYNVVFERIEDDTWNAVGGNIAINQWSHVVGTFDGTNMNLYVNGELADTGTFGSPVSLPDSSQDFQIAGDGGDFAGSIDDVAIYTRSLTQNAVRLHYGEHQLYDYDDLYRLTGVTYGNGDEVTYGYDAVGNRVSQTVPGGSFAYAYDAADRISSITPSGGPTFYYTWADNGNLETRVIDTLGWNAADQLVSANVFGATTTFTYNGDGLRESRTFDSSTTTFTWDINWSIPQVLDDETYDYLYGVGRISQVGSSATQYYLTDGLGTTLALTDDSGDIANAYEYDVFGRTTSATGVQANEFQFAGEQVDSSTGLQYLRARYYDMNTGTFISRDRLRGEVVLPQSQNRFTYVEARPTTFVDPWGFCKLKLSLRNAKDCAKDVVDVVAQSYELGHYACYAASYGALDQLGRLPDWAEVYFLPQEAPLTVVEGYCLTASAFFDFIPDGEIENVPDKEGVPVSWWPDFLENLLGGNSEDSNCWSPCTPLPGISRDEDGNYTVDFQFPLGN
jgi:RHS repeat-associated protein